MIIDSIPRTYSTYNGRKFSDYNIIVFTFGVNENDIRTQIIASIGSNNEYSNTVEYVPSCYTDKLHQVVFKIESDTYISIYKASGSMSYVEVWGLKL